jgi:hypothetical protein
MESEVPWVRARITQELLGRYAAARVEPPRAAEVASAAQIGDRLLPMPILSRRVAVDPVAGSARASDMPGCRIVGCRVHGPLVDTRMED